MKIGIFLAYPPRSELSNQGLGRLLRELIAGIGQREDNSVTVICPSWLRDDLSRLLAGMPNTRFEIIGREKTPLAVRLHARFFARRRKKAERKGLWSRLSKALSNSGFTVVKRIVRAITWLVSAESDFLVILGLLLAGLSLFVFVPAAFVFAFALCVLLAPKIARRFLNVDRIPALWKRAKGKIAKIKLQHDGRPLPRITEIVLDEVMGRETAAMVRMANSRTDVDIWYSPTVFWPEFNGIRAPKIQAFPDMLISEFPTAFATNIRNASKIYKSVKQTIEGGRFFTAYSSATASKGLSEQFDVPMENIAIIPHAAMDLAPLISIKGTLDDDYARDRFARNLIEGYRLTSWQHNEYLANFDFTDTDFMFYASQFRPNKNIMNLVQGYEIALRKKYVYAKLILTGDLKHAPEVAKYIANRRLQYDVLIAYDVPDQVLAALYSRARLIVNPTLYEGGFPFTFSEGMSVGTPSIMSRIPQVTEYVYGELANSMLFDTTSPEDIADKMAWGLNNRQKLIELQQPLYESMKSRTWKDVASDHIAVFEKVIATSKA